MVRFLNTFDKSPNRIFTDIFKIEFPDDYAEIFGEINSEVLDMYALLLVGDRYVIPFVTPENTAEVAKTYISVNMDRIKRIAKTMKLEYDTLNSDATITTTETQQRDTDNTDSATDAEKVFNDVEFTDDKQSKTNFKGNETTTTYSSSNVFRGMGKSATELVRDEADFADTEWMSHIVEIVVKPLVIDIY